jgi:hypothetical protein
LKRRSPTPSPALVLDLMSHLTCSGTPLRPG